LHENTKQRWQNTRVVWWWQIFLCRPYSNRWACNFTNMIEFGIISARRYTALLLKTTCPSVHGLSVRPSVWTLVSHA